MILYVKIINFFVKISLFRGSLNDLLLFTVVQLTIEMSQNEDSGTKSPFANRPEFKSTLVNDLVAATKDLNVTKFEYMCLMNIVLLNPGLWFDFLNLNLTVYINFLATKGLESRNLVAALQDQALSNLRQIANPNFASNFRPSLNRGDKLILLISHFKSISSKSAYEMYFTKSNQSLGDLFDGLDLSWFNNCN